MVKLIGTMLALAALAALGIWLLWGNTALTAHEISVSSPRLPGAFDGLRIAQVSDLHNAQFGPDNAGLLSLLEERPLSEISVVDICQRAMVHRTTFYAHFDDKLALLRYAVDELQKYFEPVDPSLDPRTGPREYFMAVSYTHLTLPTKA